MKITYYRFDDEISLRKRILIYMQEVEGRKNITDIPENMAFEKFGRLNKSYPQEIQCSTPIARKLLNLYGGDAYIEYIDREGNLLHTSPITPIIASGGNTGYKYL